MKIAFLLSGQPRFTPNILELFTQLKGFDQADLFSILWKSDWAVDDNIGRTKIEKILPGNWTLKEFKLVNEPEYILPINTPPLDPPSPENVAWWYKRQYSQFKGLKMTADLVPDNHYDVIARIRGDCSLDREFDFSTFNINKNIIIPNNSIGWDDAPFNDQFFFSDSETMKKFLTCIENLPEYVVLSEPNWYNEPHGKWRGEWLNGTFLKQTKINGIKAPYNIKMNTHGRSKFTDKHYHHGIAPDPTEE